MLSHSPRLDVFGKLLSTEECERLITVGRNHLTPDEIVDGKSGAGPASMHGGAPVSSGEKWIAKVWFREHAALTKGAHGGVMAAEDSIAR